MKAFRAVSLLALLGSAFAANAATLNFDDLPNGAQIGNSYLAAYGVSFVNGTALRFSTAPSPSNVLVPDTSTLTINSPVNSLVSSVGLLYSSNSVASGPNVPLPTLSAYSGLNGTGTLLGSVGLSDVSGAFSSYSPISLSFGGEAHSFVVSDQAFSHILIDNLSFTSAAPVPEPSTFAVLGLGAAALLRRRKR